jgi:zinc transport system permease protein
MNKSMIITAMITIMPTAIGRPPPMLDALLGDFFNRAIIGGIGVALVAGPLGCFIVWRRLAYFGDTLSHAALLGVALGLLANIDITLSVFAVSIVVALSLVALRTRAKLSADALLGLLAHSVLAIGLVALAFMTWVRFDMMGLLFGDILAVSRADIALIYAGGAVVLAVLAAIWKPLFAATVSPDIAAAEGMDPRKAEIIFMILLATVVAISMKITGVLLITAMLIIPAATARRFSAGPEAMAVISALAGIASVLCGLFASRVYDTPSGPSIVVAALALFLLSLTPIAWRRPHHEGVRS